MKRSPEIEALIRRVFPTSDREMELNTLSNSQMFLAIGTAEGEWWRGRDELLAVEDIQSAEMEQHRDAFALASLQLTHVEAYESGPVGWAAATSELTGMVRDRAVMRSTIVLLLEAGAWRFIHMHHSFGASNEEIFGFELTPGLEELVSSVAREAGDTITAVAPVGTTTVMFTDIEGSTLMSQRMGDEAWALVIRDHFEMLRRVVESQEGMVVKTLGDGGMFTFPSARAGLTAATKIQQALSNPSRGADLGVRVGLHSGDVLGGDGDYVGVTVSKAARIAAVAQRGEIMASTVTAELAGDHEFEFGTPRSVALKGLEGTHRILAVNWERRSD